jgi:hypothetical protein
VKLALRIILLVGGVTAVLIALGHIAFGTAWIPGAGPVNATLDSEDRFYAAMFLGFGAALLWCAQSIEQRGNVIRFLLAIFFLGGCARVISVIVHRRAEPALPGSDGRRSFASACRLVLAQSSRASIGPGYHFTSVWALIAMSH